MDTAIHSRTVVRPSARAVFRRLAPGKGAVLLHLDTAGYFGLNEVGRVVWELLGERGLEFGVLVAAARDAFESPSSDMDEDVSQFLSALSERGLLELERRE